MQGSRAHRVQGVDVGLVLHEELEHLVGAVEGGVVQRGLVALVPGVHTEAAGVEQDSDNLGDSLTIKMLNAGDRVKGMNAEVDPDPSS